MDFWRGCITGKTGRSNNVEWLEYSCTALAQAILERTTGRDITVNGYLYSRYPTHGMTLSELRRVKVGAIDW